MRRSNLNQILTIIIGLLLCGTASAQQIIEWSDLETFTDNYQRIVYYKQGKKKPLDGTYRIKRGSDEEVVSLNKGLMSGPYCRWRDGILREEGYYVDGMRNGPFVEYYQDGVTHRKDTPMQAGKIDGKVTTYYSDGKVESEKEYRQSLEHGIERRYSQTAGKVLIEGQWVDGKKEGEWREQFDAGGGVSGTKVQHYRDGKLDGPYRVEMTQDGKPYLTIRGQFTGGRKSGTWSQYDATLGNTREWEEK